ncbi:MAG: two-component system response regulator CreB [Opitutae bacterium]|nr:two-component system response regulator CreB [Opitutae bacterium]
MLPRILIVEDEPAIADTLVYALKTEGFAPQWCQTGGEALRAVAADGIALVILDVGLPDLSGFEVCKRIRARSAVPILFLTARQAEVDRVVGLEIGGDDYVVKPFSPREIAARVKAILRRSPQPARNVIRDKPPADSAGFAVDEERCEIRFNDAPLPLTRHEYRLLKTLVARPGRVFSRDELMAAAWDDPGASFDRTVDAHIKTLRAKLRAVAPDADPIETRRGLGYALRPPG